MAVIAVCAALAAVGVVIVARWRPTRPALHPVPRYLGVCAASGAIAGVLAAGAGGRLVMRLLALTSDANGAFTEAEAQIGEITAGGTLGFILFAGVPAGLLAGLLYALAGPLLPGGRVGGLALGAILLVLAGATVEPLRADNFDFALVGPDWLSVLAFTALALFQGMLTAAIAGRLSRPGPRPQRLLYGRIALAAAVLVALPGFAGAVGDILGGGG